MTYTLLIRPEAEADMAEAQRWYDQQRKGLGDAFLLCVEEALRRIRRTPEIHAVVLQAGAPHSGSPIPLRGVLPRRRCDRSCLGRRAWSA